MKKLITGEVMSFKKQNQISFDFKVIYSVKPINTLSFSTLTG